jgi:glycosyltransferase involved in cell wall biosynthesis
VKLIFVNRYFHPDHSATSQILTDLAFRLANEGGWTVEVVTSRQRYDDPAERLPAAEEVNGVRVRRVWTTRFGRRSLPGRALDYLSFYFSAALGLLRCCAKGDVIVAMTDPPLISIVAGAVARVRGARLVNWIQDVFPEVARALGVRVPLHALLGRLRDASLRAAAANVVLGDRMAEWAGTRGVPQERVAVIPNWADGDAITPLAPADNPLRAAWGLGGRFVVAYSGNLGRAHDYATLLDAAERLQDQTDIVFLFIGGGHLRPALEAEARARALASVRWLPYQPRQRLGESLAAADVHWASLRPELEGLIVPSKIYGILAAGRPALFVGDRNGEIGGLLRRHDCGISVAIGRGDELAAAILRLRDSPELCRTMGERARIAFEQEGSRERRFAAWDALFLHFRNKGAQAA